MLKFYILIRKISKKVSIPARDNRLVWLSSSGDRFPWWDGLVADGHVYSHSFVPNSFI